MVYALVGMIIVSGIQAVLLWRATRELQRVDKVDARLGHLTDALTLLAETTEAGFRASAEELKRIAEETAKPARPARATTAVASRPGTRRPVRKPRAAATTTKDMSEGEVHLRLHLAGNTAGKNGSKAARETNGAALRA